MKKFTILLLIIISANRLTAQHSFSFGCGGAALDYGRSVCTDMNGNVFVTGSYNGHVDFDPGANASFLNTPGGENQAFLAKYDSSGNLLWKKVIGDSNVVFMTERGTSIVSDQAGNIYFAGVLDANSMIAKFNNNGDSIWSFPLADMDGPQVAVDNFGNLFVGGSYFLDSADFDPGPNITTVSPLGSLDIVVAKYDTAGHFKWVRSMGGTGDDHLFSIAPDMNGDVYASGDFFSQIINYTQSVHRNTMSGTQGGYLVKFDSVGTYQWNVTLEGQNTNDNNTGASVKTDLAGNVYWYGNFSLSHDFNPGGTAHNITAGTTFFTDMFLAKYNSSGIMNWAFSIEDLYNGSPQALAIDAQANVFLTGGLGGTTDFAPGPDSGFINVAVNHDYDAFVAKYDSTGNYIYGFAAGGKGSDASSAITLDPWNNIIITGSFADTAFFDNDNLNHQVISNGSYDMFLARYHDLPMLPTGTVCIWNMNSSAVIFPNPIRESATLQFTIKETQSVEIKITDLTGRTIRNISSASYEKGMNMVSIPFDGVSKGLYFISVMSGEEKISLKCQKM